MNHYPHINVQRQIRMQPHVREVFIEYNLTLPPHSFSFTKKYLGENKFESVAGEVPLCEQVEQKMKVSNNALAIIDSLEDLDDISLTEAVIELESEILTI